MDMNKLKPGEIIAAVGAIIMLIGILFLPWYSFGGVESVFGDVKFGVSTSIKAWDGPGFLGVIANLIILIAGVVGIGLAVVKLASKSVSLPVAASALTAGTGIAAVVMIVLRIIFQPGGNISVSLKYGIFFALIGAIVESVGGWMSMKEEGATFSEAKDQLSDRMGGDSDSEGGGPTGGAPPPPPGSGPPPPSGGGPGAA